MTTIVYNREVLFVQTGSLFYSLRDCIRAQITFPTKSPKAQNISNYINISEAVAREWLAFLLDKWLKWLIDYQTCCRIIIWISLFYCMFVLFLYLPDSTLSYTETVPPLFSNPPHVMPRDYTGEQHASLPQKYMNIVTRQMFLSAACDVENWYVFLEKEFSPQISFGSTNVEKFLTCMNVFAFIGVHSHACKHIEHASSQNVYRKG